jgi:hypothetical protein
MLRSRVLLSSAKLVKNFPVFYGTRRFITVFTRIRHLSQSWARWIQSIPSKSISPISIYWCYIQIKFEVLTATRIKMAVFWNVALRSLVDTDRRFRGTSFLSSFPCFILPCLSFIIYLNFVPFIFRSRTSLFSSPFILNIRHVPQNTLFNFQTHHEYHQR